MLSTRDYLITLITNMSHKTQLLSCKLRYSSKLQKIQSLENFISMVIQSTQVLMYTKHTLFFFFYKKQNKAKLKTNKQKTRHNINVDRLKNKKAKHTSNA